MRSPWWTTLLLSGLIVTLALGATENEDLDRNRRLFERWRADPEHYGRLQRDLRAFYSLPSQRQEQLRALDQQLHSRDTQTQAALWSTLERYTVWLETLTPTDRQQILAAPTSSARFAIIREMRLRQWLPTLPQAARLEVEKLPVAEQAERIAQLRADERSQLSRWDQEWYSTRVAVPRPTRLDELPPESRAYVEGHLLPRLGDGEKGRLGRLVGKHPDWLNEIEKLADAHPILPPVAGKEIKTYKDLPLETQQKLGMLMGKLTEKGKKTKGMGFSRFNNKWPEYALEVSRIASSAKMSIAPLGASRPGEFSAEVQSFYQEELLPVLPNDQKAALNKLEGVWPDYPKQLVKVAREQRLVVPGMSLPGPVEMWETARMMALVGAPDNELNRFVENQLTPKQRAEIKWTPNTPPHLTREKINAMMVPLFNKKIAEEYMRKKGGGPNRGGR